MNISIIKAVLRRNLINLFNFNLFVNFHLFPTNILDYLINLSLLPSSLAIKYFAIIKPALFEYFGERKALYLFKKTCKLVPAYKKYLYTNSISPQDIHNINDFDTLVPQTTKENYVRKYQQTDRCLKGKLPRNGYLEESAGTSGISTNWVRSIEEEKDYVYHIKTTMTYLYNLNKHQKYIILNGFMLGGWAGSQRFSSRIGSLGIIKDIGTDVQKIIQSIKDHGPEYYYLIGGYPPFLKELIEEGKRSEGFDWKKYNVHLLTGGEGFVEDWRDYISSQLKDSAMIYSIYGAIDLDTGIAMETPLSIAIRKLINKDNNLRIDLLSTDRYPCFLGQYSPVNFYIRESINKDKIKELEITVLNLKSSSPKIKYNIGDEGGIIKFYEMCKTLEQRGYDISKIVKDFKNPSIIPFPFLYLFGRSDGTVTINGAIISPSDINKVLLSDRELASKIKTFKLSVETDIDCIRLFIYLEARKGIEITKALTKKCYNIIVPKMLESNECFRLSYERNPEASKPVIEIMPFRTGIFKDEGEFLKHRYIK